MKKRILCLIPLFLFVSTLSSYGNDFTNLLRVQWRFPLDGKIIYKPAVDCGGNIYAVTDSKKLYSIRSTGILNWKKKLMGKVSAPPLVGYDGSVIVSVAAASENGSVYSFKPNSTVRWVFKLKSEVTGSMSLGNTGNIYIPSGPFLYVIDYRGKLIFRYGFSASISAGPSVSSDNTVYIGTNDGRLYAVKSTGRKVWEVRLKGVPNEIIIGKNGNIYAGYSGVFCISPNGKVLWNYRFAGKVKGLLENRDGSITAAGASGKLYRISSTGEKVLELDLGIHHVKSLPGIINASTVSKETGGDQLFVTSEDGILYLASVEGKNTEKIYELLGRKNSITGITVVSSNRGILMYSGTEDWILSAIKIENMKQSRFKKPNAVYSGTNRWSFVLHDSCNTARLNGFFDSNNGAYLSIREKAFSDYRELKASALDSIEEYLNYKIFMPLYADKIEEILGFLSSESVYNKQYVLGKIVNDFPSVRAKSNTLLGLLGTERARGILVKLLEAEQNETVESACITSLGLIGMDPEGASERALAEVLMKNKNNERITVNVIKSLERIGVMNRGFKFKSTYSKLISAAGSVTNTAVQRALEETFKHIGKYTKRGEINEE